MGAFGVMPQALIDHKYYYYKGGVPLLFRSLHSLNILHVY